MENPCDTRVHTNEGPDSTGPKVHCKRQMRSVKDKFLQPDDAPWENSDDGFDIELGNWVPPFKEIQDVLQPDYTVACIGRRGTGKSFMIRHIIYYMRHVIPRWYVFTNTKMNRFFMDETGIPDAAIFPKMSVPVLHTILEQQKARVQKAKEKIIEGEDVDIDELRIGIVLDDIGSDQEVIRHSAEMHDIFYHGRHSWVFFIISEQYLKLIGPGARKNVDVPIMFCPDSEDEARDMVRQWLGFMPLKEGKRLLWRATRPETLLNENGQVEIDEETGKPKVRPVAVTRDTRKTAKVDHPMETIFRTSAGDPPPYLSCCPEQWMECREDADEAYRHAQVAYLNRKSKSSSAAIQRSQPQSQQNPNNEHSEIKDGQQARRKKSSRKHAEGNQADRRRRRNTKQSQRVPRTTLSGSNARARPVQ